MTDTQTTTRPPIPPTSNGNGTALNIILAVIGALVILTLLISSARSAFATLSRENSTQSADIAGVTNLEISAGSGRFDLHFAKVQEATLEVDSSDSQEWQLKREGNKLSVDSPDSWGDWCFFGCSSYENKAVLTLPESMNDGSMDAYFDLSSGELDAVGSYKNLEVEVGAGSLDLSGTAKNAKVQIGAGDAEVSLEDVEQADFDISAGQLQGTLSGKAPKQINAEVSAGSLELELPDVTYDLRQDVSAGDVSNKLATDMDSPNKISVNVSAGNATFHPQDSGPGPWNN
ncbi:DUF4097 family beta strand repeat-containing protein [Arthrobacter sp. S41]|uniref:DUF4097 family beta strand repeat-containing protein n=1 Tax=Arthrobacter sp. S41 TaxID=2509721 RepID=UPI001036BE0C|nr:DUF4097 family beta strand repeat-containing protein [Arthrobacter sp. S41]TAP28429.1 hypothetical protein EYR88_09050 [Arthrobacter sp. S41]